MKAIKKHFIATLAVLATVATSLAGVLFKAPVTTNAAEGELFRESFTFAEAVGAISYTEEELAATGMTLSGGVLGGATSNLTAEQLAVKETFYKTAYGRSPLKYYMAYKDAYAAAQGIDPATVLGVIGGIIGFNGVIEALLSGVVVSGVGVVLNKIKPIK